MSGHAGKCCRFLVYELERGKAPRELERLEFPKELSFREFSGVGPHPLDTVQAVIVGSAGPGFVGRMAMRGIEVARTSESDPAAAVAKYLQGSLPPPGDAESQKSGTAEAAEFLKAMANETRLRILCALSLGEKCVSELEQNLELSQSTVSQELARLRRAGLVVGRHAGANVYYRLVNRHVATIISAICEDHCDRARKIES